MKTITNHYSQRLLLHFLGEMYSWLPREYYNEENRNLNKNKLSSFMEDELKKANKLNILDEKFAYKKWMEEN